MKKVTQVTVPAQMYFSVRNHGFQHLTVSPTLYRRSGVKEPFEYYVENNFNYSGGVFSTGVRTNVHGQRYNYFTASQELRFESPPAAYSFNAQKFENQVTYSTNSPSAAIVAMYLSFDDFLAGIDLEMGIPADRKTDEAGTWCEVQINDQVIKHFSADPVSPAPKQKASQVIIADTDKFSFLSNVNIYFSGCDVYRELPSGQVIKIDRQGEGTATLATGYYLTPDKGYPPGVRILTIKDGFSEAMAIIDFDHDTASKQVTITIKSFTSRLCDIRDAPYGSAIFPNAICFTL